MRMNNFLLLILLTLAPLVTYGEGRCPPGQYPVGGQGAGGCAPIPASQGEGVPGRVR